VSRRILFPFLLTTIALFIACSSPSVDQSAPAPAGAVQAAAVQSASDAGPPDAIPAVDPIWDAMAKRQAYLDEVEKIRTGNDAAVSCQKVGHVFSHRIVVDTSRCNPIQLRIEKDAAHQQMFDKMVKTLHHD
jgi:hypothetical protein